MPWAKLIGLATTRREDGHDSTVQCDELVVEANRSRQIENSALLQSEERLKEVVAFGIGPEPQRFF